MDIDFKTLLTQTFSKPQPQQPIEKKLDLTITPDQLLAKKQTYNTEKAVRANMYNNIQPQNNAMVQSSVWGNGNMPPPKPTPGNKMDTGTAPSMGDKSGWNALGK